MALSAPYAVLSPAAESIVADLAVLHGEDLRDRNTHGAAVGAIVAGGAGNGFVSVERIDCLQFPS